MVEQFMFRPNTGYSICIASKNHVSLRFIDYIYSRIFFGSLLFIGIGLPHIGQLASMLAAALLTLYLRWSPHGKTVVACDVECLIKKLYGSFALLADSFIQHDCHTETGFS